jgi:glycosyltransferase involved in cell wall biosynthesis
VKSKGAKMPPIGINVHGYEMFQKFPNLKAIPSLFLLKMFVKPLLKKSDIVFSYGGKITSLLTDIINIPKEKIIEIPGGIENSWINSNSKSISDKVRFVFLGRAERRKGIEELNEVLRLINTTIDFSFTFIGPIPEHLKINSQKISYLGEIRNTKDLQQVLFDHDVLVCPSHSEGMPNVILEGMANQLAIIATDVGAVNMMVDKENGWLLQGTDTKVLQKTLINVSQMDKSELIKMQKKSLEIVQHKFLWDKIVNFLIDACQLVKK